KFFQDFIGKKTGVMPGDEMLHAYNRAVEDGRDIALIDQDIRVTVKKLQEVRLSEKVKAAASLVLGVFSPIEINLENIPEEEFLDRLLYEMEFKFPELHNVLVKERNIYMAESLKHLQDENPDAEIIAFVGAAHRKAIEEMLKEDGYAVAGESGMARDE
ncbi:MAG: TraB/GumN family protein, partial [Candidatus Aenigmatarchaeota archaeon]